MLLFACACVHAKNGSHVQAGGCGRMRAGGLGQIGLSRVRACVRVPERAGGRPDVGREFWREPIGAVSPRACVRVRRGHAKKSPGVASRASRACVGTTPLRVHLARAREADCVPNGERHGICRGGEKIIPKSISRLAARIYDAKLLVLYRSVCNIFEVSTLLLVAVLFSVRRTVNSKVATIWKG